MNKIVRLLTLPAFVALGIAMLLAPGQAAPGSPTKPAGATRDFGADVAVVTAPKAVMRKGPGAGTPVVMGLKRGDALALLGRKQTGGTYNVVHVQSGKSGWVNANQLQLYLTKQKKQTQVFQEKRTGTSGNPRVVVSNDSNRTINLRLGTKTYTIPANSKKTIQVPPADYSYYAWAAGVLPASGQKEFKSGNIYTWSFYIRTRRR